MATEKFDYESVKSKMSELEDLFDRFARRLNEINMYVNENVDIGPGSAIFGDSGRGALNAWNENAATFGDFKANFDKWSQLVTIVSMNNMSFEAENFRTTGLELNGVQGSRADIAKNMASDVISESVYTQGNFTYKTVVTPDGTTVTKYNKDGGVNTITTTSLDADGNTIRVEKIRTCITTTVLGASGAVLSCTKDYYCGYKSVEDVNGNIKYYDANGKQISLSDFNSALRMNSAGDGYLQNESSYEANANATNYGESIIKNIKGVPESVIETGAAYSMSAGTAVIGDDGNTYYFQGMATKGSTSGVMYFSASKSGSSSSQLFIIDEYGKVTPTNLATGMLASNTDAKIATTVRMVNKDLNISDLVVKNGDSKWAVTQDYIEAMDGSVTNVSKSSQLGDIFESRSSFTLANGKQLTETDYRNSTSGSDVFYNSTDDMGVTSNTYYHDRNNDNIVSNYEVWEGKGTQEAFEKAIERGDNKKKTSSGYLFDVENKK